MDGSGVLHCYTWTVVKMQVLLLRPLRGRVLLGHQTRAVDRSGRYRLLAFGGSGRPERSGQLRGTRSLHVGFGDEFFQYG